MPNITPRLQNAEQGDPEQGTWTLIVSALPGEWWNHSTFSPVDQVARCIAERTSTNVTVTSGLGVWNEYVESAVVIRTQAWLGEVENILDVLAEELRFLNDVHVEYHEVETQFVSLHDRRISNETVCDHS